MRVLVLGATALPILLACGACGHAGVPSGASGSIEPLTCGPKDARCTPLVIDQPAEVRKDLGVAMVERVAVVAADGHSIKFLPECTADGSYRFVRLPRDVQAEQLSDTQMVAVNLPNLAGLFGGQIAAEYQHGAALDMAYEVVGSRRSTIAKVTRDDLDGPCDGATHYVRSVDVGQFSVKRGTRGSLRTAAQLFGIGAQAETSSAASFETAGGMASACSDYDGQSQNDLEPPVNCSAPVRVELVALRDGDLSGAGDLAGTLTVATCPAGFVSTGGVCAPPGATPHQCDPRNLPQCEAQCAAGYAGSCVSAGALNAKTAAATAADAAATAARADFKRACDLNSPAGCYAQGAFEIDQQWDDDRNVHLKTAYEAFDKGCKLTSGPSCTRLGTMYQDQWLVTYANVSSDMPTSARYYARGCDDGDALGCARLAGMLVSGTGVAKDLAKAALVAKRACDGGEGEACHNYAYALQAGIGLKKDPTLAAKYFTKSCALGEALGCIGLATFYEMGAAATGTSIPRDDAKATALLLRGAAARSVITARIATAILLGVHHQKAPPNPQDDDDKNDTYTMAKEWGKVMIQACEGGLPRYCAYFGFYLLDGQAKEGRKEIADACTQGDAWACFEAKRVK
jgi:TPR repeat protein